MILFFKEKSASAVVWLVILFALVHTQFLFHSPQVIIEGNNSFSDLLLQPFQTLQPLLVTLVYSSLILTQALRLNFILNDERMFPKAAFTTAMSYILLTAMYPLWQNVSAALLCNTLLIWVLHRIFKFYHSSVSTGFIFNTGFICGALIIFYQPSYPLLLILFFATGILRSFNFNKWLVLILGVLSPFYMLFAYLFLTADNDKAIWVLSKFHPHLFTGENRKIILFTSLTALTLIVYGMIVLSQHISKMIIQVRKNWMILFLVLIFFIPFVFLFDNAKFSATILVIVPAAAFVSCIFSLSKKQFFPLLIFWLTVIEVIYVNWFL